MTVVRDGKVIAFSKTQWLADFDEKLRAKGVSFKVGPTYLSTGHILTSSISIRRKLRSNAPGGVLLETDAVAYYAATAKVVRISRLTGGGSLRVGQHAGSENQVGSTFTRFHHSVGAEKVSSLPKCRPALSRLNDCLGCRWTVGPESTSSDGARARIVCRFHARDLHLVPGPSFRGHPVRFRVLIEGEPPSDDRGVDGDPQGMGIVTSARPYQLVRQKGAVRDHHFEIEFLSPGVRAYLFTFG